ncbi:DNA breaking-rejoining protein [Klebsiella sp. I138]|uniref:DNA breaking-rejoining protein n=1 Tax=Klebsiella sp. I138 TaxID=2755385 RepID=UPI003DA98D8C
MKNLKLIVGGLICAGCLFAPLSAIAGYKINTIPVHFDKGTSGTSIKNTVSGADVKDYTLVVKAGQLMHVAMKSQWPHPYFNIINPANETIFNGSMTEGAFEQRLETNGKYTVRVYQMGGARDEGKTSPYELDLKVTH